MDSSSKAKLWTKKEKHWSSTETTKRIAKSAQAKSDGWQRQKDTVDTHRSVEPHKPQFLSWGRFQELLHPGLGLKTWFAGRKGEAKQVLPSN